ADDVAEVPPKVVAVTSTIPWPGGTTAVRANGLVTFTVVEAVGPKSTVVAEVNPVPLTVTVVPPPAGPPFGDTEVTVGGVLRASAAGRFSPAVGPPRRVAVTVPPTANWAGVYS